MKSRSSDSIRPMWVARLHPAWNGTLNWALFVPPEQAVLRRMLIESRVDDFLAEVHRMAEIRSLFAQAMLGYLELTARPVEQVRHSRIVERVSPAAAAGNAFAQYVLAWSLWHQGKWAESLAQMRRAGLALFPPAMLDLGRFAWFGWGMRTADRIAARELLWQAHRIGHKAALQWLCRLQTQGAAGLIGRVTGHMGFLPMSMRYSWFLARDPFSVDVFFYNPEEREGVLTMRSTAQSCETPDQDVSR